MNGFLAGIKFGIGVGIGIMTVSEVKNAIDRHMLKRKVKGLWSDIKKAWNEATAETN